MYICKWYLCNYRYTYFEILLFRNFAYYFNAPDWLSKGFMAIFIGYMDTTTNNNSQYKKRLIMPN